MSMNPGRNNNLIIPGQNDGGIQHPAFRTNNLGNGVGRGMGLGANLGGAGGMMNNAQFGAGFSSNASAASRADFSATQKSSSKYSSAFERSTSASSYSSQTIESTHQNLRYALGRVPWMKFKIVAEPDMGAFMSNPQLEAFIRSITETTMTKVTKDIVAEFNATLQQAIERTNETITTRLSNVTDSVIEQITSLTNVGGMSTELRKLEFGYDEKIDIQGGGGGMGGSGGGGEVNIDIFGGGGNGGRGGSGGGIDIFGGGGEGGTGGAIDIFGGGGGGGGAVIIEQPTVTINVINNCERDHKDDCDNHDNGHECPCPPKDSCPAIDRYMEPAMVAPPNLAQANWIWTKEVVANPTPPGEARPFRKVIKTKCPVNRVTVDITCDNYYSLYVNGKFVGTTQKSGWYGAQRYTVEFTQTTEVVIAVYAVQDPKGMLQVGLLCAGVVWHSQTKSPVRTSFITDESWKTFSGDDFDMDFYKQGFSDGSWENAHSEGPYPTTAPWAGQVVMPTKSETQNGSPWTNPWKGDPNGGNPVPDAPNAKPAKLVTADSNAQSDNATDKATQGAAPSKEPKGREGRSGKSSRV